MPARTLDYRNVMPYFPVIDAVWCGARWRARPRPGPRTPSLLCRAEYSSAMAARARSRRPRVAVSPRILGTRAEECEYLVLGIVAPAQEGKSATGTHHGGDARKGRFRVVEEHHAEIADDHVADIPAERACLRVPPDEAGVGSRGLRRQLPGDFQHRPGQVEPHGYPARTGNAGRVPASALRGLRRGDRGRAAPAADIEYVLARRDCRRAEQVRGQVPMLSQVPLTVLDPVLAARSIPALRLRRVGRPVVSHRWSPPCFPPSRHGAQCRRSAVLAS